MPPSIAVLGGGLSGLTVAFDLCQSLENAQITLFESSSRFGGVIGTERVSTPQGDFVLDLGADMFATDPPAAIQLCRELGLESRLLTPRTELAGAMIVRDGALHRIPEGFVLARATRTWPMMTTPVLSPLGKLRFLLERWKPRSLATAVQPGAESDESVADFIRHRMGREVLDRLAGPLVAGIYTADIERLSLRATLGPLAAMVSRHGSLAAAAKQQRSAETADRTSAGARYGRFRGLPGGTGELIESLHQSLADSERVNLRTDTPVESLGATATASWRVATAGGEQEFDEVVLATPARISATLLERVEQSDTEDATAKQQLSEASRIAAENLASIESSSAAIVVLAVPTAQIARLPRAFGIVVPEIEGRDIIAISFASHKYEGRCPEDHTLIRVFVGGAKRHELVDRDDAQLIELVRRELRELIGLGDGETTLSRVVRWRHSMPQYHVGHLSRVRAINDAINSMPGLSLTCNALHGVGIAPVVTAARKVAASVRERWTH